MVKFSLLHASALGLLIISNVSETQSFDLFKGNNKDGNNEAVAATVPVQYGDASTGTVTELSPGMEKKPTTCNEIMAKAVVVANEERASALLERDAAIETSKIAFASKDEMEIRMNTAIEAKNHITDKIEGIAQDAADRIKASETKTEKEIEEMKNSTDSQIKKVTNDAAAEIQKAKDEAEAAIKSATDEADEIVAKTKTDAEAQINAADTKASLQVEEIQGKMEKLEADTEAKINQVTEHARKGIEIIQEEADFKVADIQEEMEILKAATQKQIDEAMEKRATEIKMIQGSANDSISSIQQQMKDMKEATAVKITNVIEEAEDEVLKTRDLAKITIEKAKKAAADHVTEIEDQMTLLQKETNQTVAKIQLQAEAEINDTKQKSKELKNKMEDKMMMVEEDAKATIDKRDKEAQQLVEMITAEADMKVKDINSILKNDQETASNTIMGLRDEIKSLELHSHQLKKKLIDTSKSLEFYENIDRPYVNFTMIREDSSSFLTRAQTQASKELDKASAKTKTIANEYVTKALDLTAPQRKVVTDLYDENLKDVVEQSIMPNILPVVEPLIGSAKIKSSEAYEISAVVLGDMYATGREYLVSAVIVGSVSGLSMVNFEAQYIPGFVENSLKYVAENPDDVVDKAIPIWSIFMIYVFRWFLVRTMVSILLLPFRVMWFFSPLRLLFGKKKKKKRRLRSMRRPVSTENDDSMDPKPYDSNGEANIRVKEEFHPRQ